MSWFSAPASETQITHGARLWLYIISGLVMFFLVVPSLIVMPMSFSGSTYLEFPPEVWSTRWYGAYFESKAWMNATKTSLTVAVLTMLLATPMGTLAAYGLHVSRFRFSMYIYVVLSLPLMVPVIMIAIGVFFLYAKLGMINSISGLVLAHSMLAVPLVVVLIASGLKSYDMNQEMVARSLGASRARAFLTITLPQIRFSVITGALLAFLTSLDEVIVALFVSGGENATITRRMFNALRDQIDPTIASISTLLIAVSMLLLITAQVFGKERD
ncbi:MAG: ABC transporter permease [Rhodospirillales bacterium]|jgi:putative spermidine/putrescine transport system permease protein|nr:ABC transporter permease [Rhodospirillales bacterium]MBT4040678.1 ABC transporter permease [Rhodospirillales bacterium]MBT4626299.1 ABC transporter permease [Rhodospirillales bacterium]MBT5353034.1 ABC transporter permease [Rhodospirillales bacterium]MBT5520511.1 ABC transporter permease [Rhodospirillales bacterium]